jgi:hypothetical protein
MMSPFQIDLLNFMLTLAVWIPASLIWLVVSQFVFRRIASSWCSWASGGQGCC